jgi:hypothetical protein
MKAIEEEEEENETHQMGRMMIIRMNTYQHVKDI